MRLHFQEFSEADDCVLPHFHGMCTVADVLRNDRVMPSATCAVIFYFSPVSSCLPEFHHLSDSHLLRIAHIKATAGHGKHTNILTSQTALQSFNIASTFPKLRILMNIFIVVAVLL